jgi:hypothetical protein
MKINNININNYKEIKTYWSKYIQVNYIYKTYNQYTCENEYKEIRYCIERTKSQIEKTLKQIEYRKATYNAKFYIEQYKYYIDKETQKKAIVKINHINIDISRLQKYICK